MLLQRTTLGPLDSGIDLGLLGYPLRVFMTATVLQRMLDEVASALAEIPEVIEVLGISGAEDLLIHTAAADASDLYRIAGMILATPGIERTETALVMRSLVDYRLEPLLERSIRRPPQGGQACRRAGPPAITPGRRIGRLHRTRGPAGALGGQPPAACSGEARGADR